MVMLFKGDRMNNYILQLAELLSMGHSTVRKELETCVADTEKYCKEHQQEYETLGCLGGVIAEEDYGCIQWLILAECLVRYNIAAMLDWKCELEDFAYFVKGLAGKRKYKLTFRTATPRQIVVASKHMRMGAMEMRQRLTLGKDVYVKAYLQDTLLAINELEKERITYEVLPEAPQYLHFQECQKRHVHSVRYDYKYFLLDREREKEWSDKD